MFGLSETAAASFVPGLQNAGTITGTAYISGGLDASPNYSGGYTSNMTNPQSGSSAVPIVIPLNNPSVITQLMVNFNGGGSGQLATKWFPLNGTGIFYDYTNMWKLILYVTSHPEGRALYFNFVNLQNAGYTFTDFPINIYGHLFSYPWQ